MRWVFLLFFFSGFSALVYEVTWARKLSLIFGTDTYAISTVIAVFFAGLALGSFLLGRNVAAMIIHDYFAMFVALIWMVFFWWFSYAYLLETSEMRVGEG